MLCGERLTGVERTLKFKFETKFKFERPLQDGITGCSDRNLASSVDSSITDCWTSLRARQAGLAVLEGSAVGVAALQLTWQHFWIATRSPASWLTLRPWSMG